MRFEFYTGSMNGFATDHSASDAFKKFLARKRKKLNDCGILVKFRPLDNKSPWFYQEAESLLKG